MIKYFYRGALTAAVQGLDVVRVAFKEGLKIVEIFVQKTLGEIFNIEEVSFSAPLSNAESGAVHGRVVLILLGETQILSMYITLRDLDGMVPALVDAAKSAIL